MSENKNCMGCCHISYDTKEHKDVCELGKKLSKNGCSEYSEAVNCWFVGKGDRGAE